MVANKLQQLLLEPQPNSPSASLNKNKSNPEIMKAYEKATTVGKENASVLKKKDSFFTVEPTLEKKLQHNTGIQKFRLNLQKGFARAASASRHRLAEAHKLSKQRQLQQQQATKQEKKEPASELTSGSNHTASTHEDDVSTNSSSGTEIIVKEKASPDSHLPISPSKKLRQKDLHPDSVSLAAKEWFARVQALCQSEEMLAFQSQTAHLIHAMGRASVQTALFPLLILQQQEPLLLGNNRALAHRNSAGMTTSTRLFAKVVSVPIRAFQVLTQVTDQVAGDLISLVVPIHVDVRKRQLQGLRKTQAERLRLDYNGEEGEEESSSTEHSYLHPSGRKRKPQEQTLYLLRVRDLGLQETDNEKDVPSKSSESPIVAQSGEGRRVAYIDLSGLESGTDRALIRESMKRLVDLGVGMLAHHPTVKLTNHKPYDSRFSKDLFWKCESNTGRLLKRMHKESVLERLQTLQSETLVWSGKFQPDSDANSQFPLYLARGILPFSAREILHLLWDNNRTVEYNNFCLGRKTIMDLSEGRENSLINDELLLAGKVHTGTKVIESETRVPFTSFTVKVQCLMHCQKLEGDAGFVIVSRSLHKGCVGTQFEGNGRKNDDGIESSGNEILWGINIIRRIPNHPQLSDLTSLSQVGFSLGVPKFLASKIALKGVEEFFSNVRKLPVS